MGRQDQIISERLKKLDALKKEGINPYPNKYDVKDFSSDLQEKHEKLKPESFSKQTAQIAGRVMTKRSLGKISFATIDDGHGKIQITLQQGETPKSSIDLFKKFVDSGDFVGLKGQVFRTKRGELSVLVKSLTLLTKSLLPLPEKFHGLKDEEEIFRKRYLDILMNPEVKQMFIRKSKFWNSVRSFLLGKGFIEVETPVLENSAGGAAATPFKTHHNALDLDVFLRISMGELWQKKLMVASFPKTFEIGRQFRNEGMDADHLQDYTQMEFYWAYANYEDGMSLVKEMYKQIAKETFGTLKFERSGHEFNLGSKWEIIDYAAEIKKQTKIDIHKTTVKEIESTLDRLKQEYEPGLGRARLIDILWKYCRRKISGPAFLTSQPVEVSPLAKRNPKDPRTVEQFQVILAGSELGNGYSELNDPHDQESRFEEQQALKDSGDSEAQDHDHDFVEALKHGMPPTCGFGFSERLFAFLEGKPIRETVLFPLLKPAGAKESKTGKSKKSKIAIALVNKDLSLEPWQEMNTIAHLNAAFAARKGKELFMQDQIETKDNEKINLNIQHAIMIKEANSNKELLNLIKRAKEKDLEIAEFTREMIETTDDRKVVEITKNKKLNDIEYLGVLLFGKKSVVEDLTQDFNLFTGFSTEKSKGGKKNG